MLSFMRSPTDLTSRIAHLRDRESAPTGVPENHGRPKAPKVRSWKLRAERKMADDYFMFFVYALLAVAMICQVGLIVFLDVLSQ